MSQQIPSQTRTKVHQPTFSLRRFRAALDIQGGTIEGLARDARVSARHVWFCLHGQRRASERLLQCIHSAIGESGWQFATGQTHYLIDAPATLPPVESAGLVTGGER